MKTLREYIDLIEATETDKFAPTNSIMWAKNSVTGSDNNLRGSMQSVKYDRNAAGEHRFTHMAASDDDNDEGTLNQRTLPANTNLSWVTNEEELEESSEDAIKRVETLFKRS